MMRSMKPIAILAAACLLLTSCLTVHGSLDDDLVAVEETTPEDSSLQVYMEGGSFRDGEAPVRITAVNNGEEEVTVLPDDITISRGDHTTSDWSRARAWDPNDDPSLFSGFTLSPGESATSQIILESSSDPDYLITLNAGGKSSFTFTREHREAVMAPWSSPWDFSCNAILLGYRPASMLSLGYARLSGEGFPLGFYARAALSLLPDVWSVGDVLNPAGAGDVNIYLSSIANASVGATIRITSRTFLLAGGSLAFARDIHELDGEWFLKSNELRLGGGIEAGVFHSFGYVGLYGLFEVNAGFGNITGEVGLSLNIPA